MLLKIILLLSIPLLMLANTALKGEYLIKTDDINISIFLPSTVSDVRLFEISKGRYTKRIKSKELIKILNKNGLKGYSSKHSYTKFTKQSPINTSVISQELFKIYKSKYKNIKIKQIQVTPRGYLSELPKSYKVLLSPKNYLKSHGVVSIKSDSKKQLFFDYKIDAVVDVYLARKKIKRNTELTNINCIKKSIILDKFKAMPLQELIKDRLQSKNHIKKEMVVTVRNIQELKLVKRGSSIHVTLNNKNIDISFSAQALEDAIFGDIIKVKQSNSKIIKVKVTAKGRGEVY